MNSFEKTNIALGVLLFTACCGLGYVVMHFAEAQQQNTQYQEYQKKLFREVCTKINGQTVWNGRELICLK